MLWLFLKISFTHNYQKIIFRDPPKRAYDGGQKKFSFLFFAFFYYGYHKHNTNPALLLHDATRTPQNNIVYTWERQPPNFTHLGKAARSKEILVKKIFFATPIFLSCPMRMQIFSFPTCFNSSNNRGTNSPVWIGLKCERSCRWSRIYYFGKNGLFFLAT